MEFFNLWLSVQSVVKLFLHEGKPESSIYLIRKPAPGNSRKNNHQCD